MTPGDLHRFAGREDARPLDRPAIDCPLERQVRVRALAGGTNRRYPGKQRTSGGFRHPQRQLGLGLVDQRGALRTRKHQSQMDVHIHQAGDQPEAAGVDHLGPRRDPGLCTTRFDRRDQAFLDVDACTHHRRPAIEVDDVDASEHRHSGRVFLRKQRRGRRNHDRSETASYRHHRSVTHRSRLISVRLKARGARSAAPSCRTDRPAQARSRASPTADRHACCRAP